MSDPGIRTVLLTGAAGRLGSVLAERLKGQFPKLRLSDIRPIDTAGEGIEFVQCDLTDRDATAALCQGVDAVLHFGGIANLRHWDELIGPNIIGAINVFDAAARAGVKRFLYASSNHVVGLYAVSERLDHTSPPRPDSAYGVSKAFGETLAAHYAHKAGMAAWCMRIGSCRPAPDTARALSTWLSYEDLHRLVIAGLTASYTFEIVYGVSRNHRSWWDNSRAYALGYSPQDNAEEYADKLADGAGQSALQGGAAAERPFEFDRENRAKNSSAPKNSVTSRPKKLYDII